MSQPKYWIVGYLSVVASFSPYSFAESSAGEADDHNEFKSDIEGMQEIMLSPNHWKNKLYPQQSPLLSSQQIAKQNTALFHSDAHMNELTAYPKVLGKTNILGKITKASKLPNSNRYYTNGKQVDKYNLAAYQESLNIKAVPDTVSVRFGMVVKRTDLRTFPTSDAVFKTPNNINLDRFQETALFPAEAVVVLHQSLDQSWYFVVSYNYSGWVKKSDIAIGTKGKIFEYKNSKSFLVVTGDMIFTTYNPYRTKVSNVQLDMGTKLTLVDKKNTPTSLDGQNTYTSYVVKLPTRSKEGDLKFELGLISRNRDVHIGYLPFTKQNILEQSFKFLGERYGWGHSFNARDCTGFIGDIYKSFGILMPRNSSQQAQSKQGQNIHFSKNASINEKLASINSLEVGDLIYIPGHVMMFLGMEDGKPFIIHDVSGLAYLKEDGSYYKSTLNGVSVTPLLPLQLNQETSYIDRIYNLKKIK
ncbi:MAG: SH3 domain-containing protein [Kangiellaceae bacterium]|nr:SH3 domain-containing protein [Kangiellaceae bacterium]